MKLSTSRSGFTLVEVMIVVSIVGMLSAIAVPNFIKNREISQRNTCIANMKQIECAKTSCALELRLAGNAAVDPSQLYGAGKFLRAEPTCPTTGAKYTLSTVSAPVTCNVPDHKLQSF